MSNAQQIAVRPNLSAQMAAQYGIEPTKFIETIKGTVMPKRQGGEPVPVSDADLMAFCMVAHEYGLNPFLKEIHAFPNKAGGITPIVGVDGWSKLMNRRPEFDGIEFEAHDEDGKPHSVTARVWIKNRSRPVSVTEYYSECQRGTEPWRTMPRRMLRHKALIQAVRVAFGFAGIHDEDEAVDIAESVQKAPRNVTPKAPLFAAPQVPAPEPAQSSGPGFDGDPEPNPEPSTEPSKVATPPPSTEPTKTDLDKKREKIEAALIGAGIGFDDLKAFLANRNMDTDAGSFAELEEVCVNRLTTSDQALNSFVRQAKRLKEGGAA